MNISFRAGRFFVRVLFRVGGDIGSCKLYYLVFLYFGRFLLFRVIYWTDLELKFFE